MGTLAITIFPGGRPSAPYRHAESHQFTRCIQAQRNRPLLLQGTLTTFRRRCGKPTCRCAAGEPHESPALRFTEDGRTKTLTLTAAEVARVTAALACS